jgi:hypothetical protein
MAAVSWHAQLVDNILFRGDPPDLVAAAARAARVTSTWRKAARRRSTVQGIGTLVTSVHKIQNRIARNKLFLSH